MQKRDQAAPPPQKQTYSAPALDKAFDVIEQLALDPRGLTVSEMAQRMQRSISEIFRIIIVMERRGWLAKEPGTDRFRVTYKMLELAHRAAPSYELTYVAAPILYALAERTGQSCHLVVATQGRGLVVLREQPPGPTGFAIRLGTQVNMLSSCSGHVLLAFAEPAARSILMDAIGEDAGAHVAAVEAMAKKVRKQGYESMPSSRTIGVTDISFPIFGFDDRVIAALTIPFLKYIDGTERATFDQVRLMLEEATSEISRGMGRGSLDAAAATEAEEKPRRTPRATKPRSAAP